MEELIFDELWSGGPVFPKQHCGFRLSTDSVMLAYFAGSAGRCLDIGSGSGVLPLLIAARDIDSHITGVEIQPSQAELSRRIMAENGVSDRVEIITGDIRMCREYLPGGGYDLIVSNPPYFAQGSGKASPEDIRAQARDERSCRLADLCSAAAYLCRWGGRFCVVHRPERLSELLCAMSSEGLEPKRLRTIHHRAESKPSLVLVEARRGGNPGLSFEAPLVLYGADGEETEEFRRIYHREGQAQ